jgi:hypothetical protein
MKILNTSIHAFVFLTVAVSSLAQEGEKSKKSCQCSFTSINQIGLLAGEYDEAFQLQTVNGFRYHSWMAGVGVGIDGYRYRTIPIFFQLRKEFGLGPNSMFIYNDVGVHYPWLKSDQKKGWVESDYTHGFYYDGGIGYKVPIKKQWLLFSGGFSLKKMSEVTIANTCPFVGPCYSSKEVYDYSLRRLSFKVGLQL